MRTYFGSAPDGGAVRLQEAVWGGTGGGPAAAAATVQGCPGVSRQTVALLRLDREEADLVSLRPFF